MDLADSVEESDHDDAGEAKSNISPKVGRSLGFSDLSKSDLVVFTGWDLKEGTEVAATEGFALGIAVGGVFSDVKNIASVGALLITFRCSQDGDFAIAPCGEAGFNNSEVDVLSFHTGSSARWFAVDICVGELTIELFLFLDFLE